MLYLEKGSVDNKNRSSHGFLARDGLMPRSPGRAIAATPRLTGGRACPLGLMARTAMPPPKGMTGIIIVVLVLGFMMAISTSFVQMIQVEDGGTKSMVQQDRARFAAFAGVNFVMARLQATPSTFLAGPASDTYKQRLYIAAGSNAFGAAFPNVATSQVLYISNPSWVEPGETASSSLFRVVSYYDSNNVATAYYVKSIGIFRDIDPGSGQVVATWQSQVIARLKIATAAQEVTLESYRPMELELTDSLTAPFFTDW